MPLYTFYLCGQDEQPYTFEAFERSEDAEAYRTAGELLAQHPRAMFVNVYAGERAVLSCYRKMPFIRAVRPSGARQDA